MTIKKMILTIAILIIASLAIAQSSIVADYYIIDNVGTYTFPEPPEPTEEDILRASEVGSTYVAPSRPSAETMRRYEEHVLDNRRADNPPIVILNLDFPRSTTSIPEERISDGHCMRSGRVYLKPSLTFTDITPGTAILGLAPLDERARINSSSTIQEAKAAIIDEYVALSRTTPDDEIYIDITDIVDAYHDGEIGRQFALYPLNPRERFEIPEESRDSHGRFDIVLTVE